MLFFLIYTLLSEKDIEKHVYQLQRKTLYQFLILIKYVCKSRSILGDFVRHFDDIGLTSKYVTKLNTSRIYLGPFYVHGLTEIPAWVSGHMPSKVWVEIVYSCQTSSVTRGGLGIDK